MKWNWNWVECAMKPGSSPAADAGDAAVLDELETLRIQVQHLRNDYTLTRNEYETAARDYLNALSHVERQKLELEHINRRLQESDRRAAVQRSAIAELVVDPDVVGGDLARATERLAQVAATTLGVARTGVWMMADGDSRLQCLTLYDKGRRHAPSAAAALDLRQSPLYVKALLAENRIRADDALTDPRTRELAESYLIPNGISSLLDAGIIVNGRLIGVFCIEQIGLRRAWHVDEELFVGTLAALVAQLRVHADHQRAQEELRKTNLRLEESAARARELAREAQEASQAKSRFLMQMSHEIRTPMNAVLGMADLLEESSLNPDQLRFLGILQSAGNHLLGVIDDILDFSKLESHSVHLAEHPFDLHHLAEKCAQFIAVKAMEKAIEVAYSVAPGIPQFILGDEQRLRQVILNLMGNAIKFTDNGSISLVIEPAGDHRLRLTVRDTGIGIPPDQLSKIFQRFYQTDLSLSRRYGGTGLGLTITREIVELMDGEIHVASTVGEGSVFTVLLPLRPASPDQVASLASAVSAARSGPTSTPLPPMRLLLAEDLPVNRDMIRFYLQGQPVEITEAVNGREAVERCARQRFDLVLMDVEMPEMDGLTAMQRIRDAETQSGSPPVPIYALTAHAMADMADKCRGAGAQQVLTKPVRKRTLLDALRRAVQAPPAGGAPPSPPPTVPPTSAPPPSRLPVDLDRLVREFDGDSALATQMLHSWLASLPALLDDLRSALGAANLEQVRRSAHAIKGAAANLAADPLAAAASALEAAALAADPDGCARRVLALQTACDELSRHVARSHPTPTQEAPA